MTQLRKASISPSDHARAAFSIAVWLLLAPFHSAIAQTVTIDPHNANNGTLDNALQFGTPRFIKGSNNKNISLPAGEGIASNRAFASNSGGQTYANGIAGANFLGLDFFTANVVRMSITNSGQIGIGTASPTRVLELQGDGDVEVGLKSHDIDGRLWTIQSSGTGTGNDPALNGTFQIVDRNAGLSRLKIDAAGVVSVRVLQITGGADVAEPFEMSDSQVADGSIVVIDDRQIGGLKVSTRPYDRRVAGVVSGAGGISPGIQLQLQGLQSGRNLALSGRVYALADARGAAIRPGDMLTTSSTPGHCMKVLDAKRARGAVLGKAMSALDHGSGLVLVLVTLQ